MSVVLRESGTIEAATERTLNAESRRRQRRSPPALRPRVVLFTDTLGDVNGVARFVNDLADMAAESGRPLDVITSTRFPVRSRPNLHNFGPWLAAKLPGYANLEFVLPPVRSMIRAAGRLRPDLIHISTPGPVGLVGMLSARLLGVPVVGVYHTDFPAYVDRLFDDDALTWLARRVVRGFYTPFRTILTRSRGYLDEASKLGIDPARCVALKPGARIERFGPGYRDRSIWPALGVGEEGVKVLSVGRVSVEKNLPLLVDIWRRTNETLRREGLRAQLVVVGDGPYRAQMENALAGTSAHFLGFRSGVELSRIYASSDLFVFPSTTDTLGQVVLESQASGLPTLVSDVGGPQELVHHGETGFVLRADSIPDWCGHILALARNPQKRRTMGAAAHAFIQSFSLRESLDHWWDVHTNTWVEGRELGERHGDGRSGVSSASHPGAEANTLGS